MEIWKPPPDTPHLLDWWVPLLAFARHARADQVPWLVTIEDFELVGRFDRPPRPSVSIYRHRQTGGQVGVDRSGQPYRFIEYHSGSSPGRLAETSVRAAVWATGLPDVALGVTYVEPGLGGRSPDASSGWSEDADEWDVPHEADAAEGEPRWPGAPVRARVTRRRASRSRPRGQASRHLSLVQSPPAS